VNFRAKAALVALTLVPVAASASESPRDRRFPLECAEFYASTYRVPIELVEAVIEVESGWNPYAVSSKGAEGLMQLMPATAVRFGVRDRFDVEENIRGGVAYLSWLMRQFDGDLRLVVAAYYCGDAPIRYRGLAYSSPDVFAYVARVAQIYRRLYDTTLQQSPVLAISTAPGGEK